jgi:tRNA uridine 5-carbamoylmethylation protein Kti12
MLLSVNGTPQSYGVVPERRPRSAPFSRILRRVATPRLVFLYGPPAVGKLTVARAIAARLPFKILHNHVTIDAVTEVLPYGSDTFWRVVGRFRRDLVTAAAEGNIDLIYTYVFAPGDEQLVAEIVSPYEKAGGTVSFVQLLAPREVLLQRVRAESRREHGKPTDPATLEQMLDRYDDFTATAAPDGLTIDLAATSAREAADRIIDHITNA